MVLKGSKRSVLGTLKPMHFSFVTLLMIFDEFDHLHLPQPRGRHGKVGTQNPIFRQNIIISKTIFSQKKGLFGHLKANAFQFCNQIYNFKPIWPSPPPTASRGTSWSSTFFTEKISNILSYSWGPPRRCGRRGWSDWLKIVNLVTKLKCIGF